MSDLAALVEEELSRPAPDAVRAFAFSLVNPARDAAVLYYGSTLRTGDLTGVLDFYRLTRGPHRRGLRGAATLRSSADRTIKCCSSRRRCRDAA